MKLFARSLIGTALNWAVAKARYTLHYNEMLNGHMMHSWWISGVLPKYPNVWVPLNHFKPSEDWNQGGPIIESSFPKLELGFSDPTDKDRWYAECNTTSCNQFTEGPTALIAAMRCYVAITLGEEVEMPEKLK